MILGIGRGHAVTPYSAASSVIRVYDSNYVGDILPDIDIFRNSDTYNFLYEAGDLWDGSLLFTIPLDVWRNDRHAPFDLDGIVTSLVFGAADGRYITPDGDQWGWHSDGTFSNEMPGVRWVAPMGGLENESRNVPLFLPLEKGAPNIQVNNRGGDYLYYSGQGGHLFQLQVFNGVAGATDEIEVGYENDRLASFRLTTGQDSSQLVPKVGLNMGERERALFRWHQLDLQGGDSVGFQADREQRAAEFTNDTSQDEEHYLVLDTVDGPSSTYGTRLFGPFLVPEGAIHRTTIVDWPASKKLLSEIDQDRDGIFETSALFEGNDCPSDDENDNAIPDACEELASSPSPLKPESDDMTEAEVYLPLVIH